MELTSKPVPLWTEYAKVIAAIVASLGTVALGVAGLMWSISSFGVQNENVRNQIRLQQTSLEFQRESAATKLASDFVPLLKCVSDERQEMALEILKIYAPEQLKIVLPILQHCSKKSPQFEKQLADLKTQGSQIELENKFLLMIENARQYMDSGAQGDAARIFYEASNSLPESYIIRNMVYLEEVKAANEAFLEGKFSEASDLFARAFRKIPRDADPFSKYQFRRGPTK